MKTYPAVEDLNSVVVRVGYDQVVIFSDADLPGIGEFSLVFSLPADRPHELALQQIKIENSPLLLARFCKQYSAK